MDAERQRKMQIAESMIQQLPKHLTSPVNIKKANEKPAQFWETVLWNTRNNLSYLDNMIVQLERMIAQYVPKTNSNDTGDN